MKKLVSRFMNLKLRTKLFISYMLIITIVAVANFEIYNIYEKNTTKVIQESSTDLVRQLSNYISYKMSTLDTNILYATEASNIFNENDFSYYYYMNLKIDTEVFNIYMENSGISIYSDLFLNLSENCFYYSKTDLNDCYSTNIYKYIQQNKEKIFNAYGKSQYVTFNDEPGIIYIVKSNITLDTHNSNGIIAIGISDNYLTNSFPKSLETGSIVICDQNSKILIGDETDKSIVNSFNKACLQNINGQIYFNYMGRNIIIESSVSENSRWKVLYVISLTELFKNVENIKNIVFVLCITLFAFSLVIAFIISGNLTSNLRLLLVKIKMVEKGDFTYKVVPKSMDETAELFNHFNIMTDKLTDLIIRIAYEKTENQRAQYNALLAQINPHFLFNVLESINGLAKIRGQDDIVNIISSLSFLMRITLNNKKSTVMLKDELNFVGHYISIQKIITGGRISIEYDIKNDVLDCMIPKLILQPLVENAINYGIEDKKIDALIFIAAYAEKDVLKINISDNGKGIQEEKLVKILNDINSFEESEDAHAHIGMKSVNRRLKILYGDEYGLEISSRQGVGTVVELSLPIKRHPENSSEI